MNVLIPSLVNSPAAQRYKKGRELLSFWLPINIAKFLKQYRVL